MWASVLDPRNGEFLDIAFLLKFINIVTVSTLMWVSYGDCVPRQSGIYCRVGLSVGSKKR